MYCKIRQTIAVTVIATFMASLVQLPQAHASSLPFMSKPGMRVPLSVPFNASSLTGLVIHPENALRFDFLVNPNDDKISQEQKQEEYMKLVKYFMASLTVPDDAQWVNLSPYEKNRIVEPDFGNTAMGRDLLAQDYLLKQITASLVYPEDNLGKEFWSRVYAKAKKEYGVTEIPVSTFNKVWIVPEKAEVFEKGNTVVILNSRLKVMLEEDYLALEKNSLKGHRGQPGDMFQTEQQNVSPSSITNQVLREIILPELQKEVNEGKNFAPLRQMYSAMILSTWFKKALKESLLGKVYSDKVKLFGVTTDDPKANEEIYQQYLKAYKKGAFNYIKEEVDQISGQQIPRKYFSGGFGKKLNLDN